MGQRHSALASPAKGTGRWGQLLPLHKGKGRARRGSHARLMKSPFQSCHQQLVVVGAQRHGTAPRHSQPSPPQAPTKAHFFDLSTYLALCEFFTQLHNKLNPLLTN